MTEILSKAGATSVQVGDQKIAGRLLLARLLWQGVTTGTIEFPDGAKIELAANDWRAMVEFLYKHIDGPPVQSVDLTSGGEKLNPYMTADATELLELVRKLAHAGDTKDA